MKTASAGMATHIAGECTTLATCWKITRVDGTVLAFTDHDRDLTVSGVTYKASSGYSRSAIANNSSLQVDNLDAEGILDSAAITADDIRAGLYRNAEVRIFLVNWADLTQGEIKMRKGWLGEATIKGDIYQIELRGLTQAFIRQIGQMTSPQCRADFGDSRCTKDLAALTQSGSAGTVTSRSRFIASGVVNPQFNNTDAGLTRVPAPTLKSQTAWPWTVSSHDSIDFIPGAFGDGVDVWIAYTFITASGETLLGDFLKVSGVAAHELITLDVPTVPAAWDGLVTGYHVWVGTSPNGGAQPALYRQDGNGDQINTHAATSWEHPELWWEFAIPIDVGDIYISWAPVTYESVNGAKVPFPAPSIDASGLPLFQGVNASISGFEGGKVTWTSGANDGLSMEVKYWDPGTSQITLFLPMPYDIEPGDTFDIHPGCRKDLNSCIAYDNVENFRGEPFIVGRDEAMKEQLGLK